MMDLQSQIDQIQKKIKGHEERIADVQKTVLNIVKERKTAKSEPEKVGFGEWIIALLVVVLVVLVLVLIGWILIGWVF